MVCKAFIIIIIRVLVVITIFKKENYTHFAHYKINILYCIKYKEINIQKYIKILFKKYDGCLLEQYADELDFV